MAPNISLQIHDTCIPEQHVLSFSYSEEEPACFSATLSSSNPHSIARQRNGERLTTASVSRHGGCFDLSPVQVGTLVNKAVLGQISLRVAYLSFPLSVSFLQCPYSYFIHLLSTFSSVGIATDYGLDGPGSNPGGDEIFRPFRPALGSTSLLYNGYRVFPGSKVRPGRAANHSPPSSAAVMEE